MTISKRVQKELLDVVPRTRVSERKRAGSALNTTREAKQRREAIAARTKGQAWTDDEHQRFLEGLRLFPSGPWETIAEYVGTKNSRQTMTHAQKYRQKHERQQRGLRNGKRKHPRASDVHPYQVPSTPIAMAKPPLTVPKFKEGNSAPVIVSTPTQPAPQRGVDVKVETAVSPRSGEEECSPQPENELFAAIHPTAEFQKLDAAHINELFTDFDDLQVFQVPTWSVNSLTECTMDTMELDQLSALPEDFSQSLALWAAP